MKNNYYESIELCKIKTFIIRHSEYIQWYKLFSHLHVSTYLIAGCTYFNPRSLEISR